jgi:hypothetical protein
MTKFSIKDGILTIAIPLDEAGKASASGKSKVHATTSGNVNTGLKVNGGDLILGLNAYTRV